MEEKTKPGGDGEEGEGGGEEGEGDEKEGGSGGLEAAGGEGGGELGVLVHRELGLGALRRTRRAPVRAFHGFSLSWLVRIRDSDWKRRRRCRHFTVGGS